MSLSPGTRLGPYEVTALIGSGGMGEVYRARDTKLGRDVALKVLPDLFADDPERLARFQREAKVLASLNHPNIASIYGLEESAGVRALVLELVEGPTLAERIAQGAIPVDEALPIARQIAEALEAAHEAGVIHRDLKPANVKVKTDGMVKVLDFGLAKALEGDTGSDPSESPTMTAAATRMGVIMGTADYMSPEQARGKTVDRRADIWAFGVVLYEMLTGQRAFAAGDVSETLAFVLTKEIDWTILPKRTPGRIRQLLRRTLERDPRQRLRDMGDARIETTEALTRLDEPAGAVPVGASIGRRAIAWGLGALIAVVAGAAVWGVIRPTPSSPAPTRRSFEDLGLTERVRNGVRAHPVVSPDGTRLVYAIQVDGTTQLYTRRLEELEAHPIPGTNGAYDPFFSPDGEWVGFFTSAGDQQLQKVSIRGGQPQPLCDACEAPAGGGATWGFDDTIVFSTRGPDQWRLFRLSLAQAGAPRVLTSVDQEQGERFHLAPHILPGGSAALFTIRRSGSANESRIAVVSLETGTYRTLIERGYNARYVPTGHVVFARAGALWAAPFDLDRLETTGPEALILEGMEWDSRTPAAPFAFSDDGLLVYVPGTDVNAGPKSSLVWVDRQGREEPLALEPARFSRPQVSPDGSRVAVAITDDSVNQDLWIYDLERERLEQLTFDPARDFLPSWTPDGQWVVFSSARESGVLNVWRKAANFTGEAERLTRSENDQMVHSCSSDGETVLFCGANNGLPFNLGRLSMGAERTAEYLTQTEFREAVPIISPDGNWVAYQSDETRRYELYVSRFPNVPEGKRRISTDGNGGYSPVWGPDGRELFYRSRQAMMMVRIIETEPAFVWEGPEVVFEDTYFLNDYRYFDISPDDQRFLMMKESESPERSSTQLVFVENWFEELKARVPVN